MYLYKNRTQCDTQNQKGQKQLEQDNDRKDRDSDTEADEERPNKQTEMCVPDQWMYQLDW